MARSLTANANAFPAEVARYLCLEGQDVDRMMRLDGLPYFTLPKRHRTVKRIPLRDLHAWLKGRASDPRTLGDYATFLADFDASARAPRTTA